MASIDFQDDQYIVLPYIHTYPMPPPSSYSVAPSHAPYIIVENLFSLWRITYKK